MTFEELQEEITSMGLGYSSVDDEDFKGLIVKNKQVHEIVRVPVDVANLFGLKTLVSGYLDWDDESELAQVLNSYMATPIEKRGLKSKSDNQKVVDRLTQEWNDLDEKLNRLDAFKRSEKFGQLPYAQMRLLDFQDQIMNTYQSILAWRIQTLGEGGQDDAD